MSQPPTPLDYATPTRAWRPNWSPRSIKLAVATCLPPVMLDGWAMIATLWMVRQPGWHSGEPFESMYRPRIIEWPMIIGTAWFGLEAVVVLSLVLPRRWPASVLVALPAIFVVWVAFLLLMADHAEAQFP